MSYHGCIELLRATEPEESVPTCRFFSRDPTCTEEKVWGQCEKPEKASFVVQVQERKAAVAPGKP